ncbi:MAG: hypothetical protein IPJ65_17170 [Archangiaceae bacterium]|nr:hypothetical protein [Archangiaceae bacterium]
MKRALVVAALAAVSCSRSREAGLEVTVQLEAGVRSRCVQVVVKLGGGAENRSTPVETAGKSALRFGVAQGTLPDDVTLFAQGFSDTHCTVPSSPPERSKDAAAHFTRNALNELGLTMFGASDTRESACDDGLDSDGDALIDCADDDCDALPCRAGGTCQGHACAGAASEAGLCDDGVDNDGDQHTDCDDSQCGAELCRSADRCVSSARCASGACTGGSQKQCPVLPGSCAAGPGTCESSTGACVYPPLDAGSPCSDGSACTAGDRCDPSGACLPGALVTCDAPPPCFSASGVSCDPARGCAYPVTVAAACDDGRSCTMNDLCGADGGCAGSAAQCVPAECQSFAGSCEADAGCRFEAAAPGAACDGGVCNGAGGCIARFPYPPANFAEAQVPTPPAGEVSLGCGLSVVDTGVAGNPVFTNWCGQPLPGIASVAQPGGPGAVLLSFERLTLLSGSTLQVKGVRPAIIAATGDVMLAGEVQVLAGAADCPDAGAGERGHLNDTNGGGGGGTFGTRGGAGGRGSDPTFGSPGNGGEAGVLSGSEALVPLRGGCPGGLGGRSSQPRPAAGGGALQISTAATLIVSGTVTAPGAGGPGANAGSGGNGAGSGGAIALEARQLTLTGGAVVAAHGGGGGEGGGPIIEGAAGHPGTADAGAAAGGSSVQTGGPGGRGSTRDLAAGDGEAGSLGTGNGGGGGGGLGRVRLRGAAGCSVGAGVLVSPAWPTDAGCSP